MSTVKISKIPDVAKPVEGVDYDVLAGDPQPGDFIRVDGRIFTVMPEPMQPPQPNTPNNPWFGKKPLPVDRFWGVVLTAYIASTGGNAAGLDRFARLEESRRARAIIKIIEANELIDPDDKDGDFLQFLGLLKTTDHETDGEKLMSSTDEAAIFAAWPNA